MAVRQILLINLIVFGITYILSASGIYLNNALALYPIGTEFFSPYQLITHLFAHADVIHIFSNMLIFILLAPEVEKYFGYKGFWKFYVLSGLFSSGLYCLGTSSPIIGASGAVFSVIAASILLTFKNEKYKSSLSLRFRNLFFISLILFEIKDAFIENDNIGHFAHVFGVIFGIIYFLSKKLDHLK
jgi:membrane associated rhomboid family serine protease